ncbi:NUDIX domain-containing protein [Metasolibacillus meyeri]|uniref:NUDIX domain-containing protein n=1 Tax=Metasolibacillus meyeri TaxID=1071052 RepID=A0AAW9NM78_9BACL|nr:NUDIX domain-containing protein [Metasolibacillus meyeri]MEC1179959.1 NUDIX domain-containing protein [Metasolibacillus meyeri]
MDDTYHVLLLKRASHTLNNTWCYIGGSIEDGETAIEAAYREIREETGITELALYSSNQFDQIFSPQENYIYIAPVFVGFVHEEQSIILNGEHSEYQWVLFEKAKEVVSLPGNEVVLQFVENNFVKKNPLKYLRV